jgi:hypothetical protein
MTFGCVCQVYHQITILNREIWWETMKFWSTLCDLGILQLEKLWALVGFWCPCYRASRTVSLSLTFWSYLRVGSEYLWFQPNSQVGYSEETCQPWSPCANWDGLPNTNPYQLEFQPSNAVLDTPTIFSADFIETENTWRNITCIKQIL